MRVLGSSRSTTCAEPRITNATWSMCWCAVRLALRRNTKKGTLKMSLVGTDVTMVGGIAKVTGAINYAPDLVLPRMLYAKALRSPYPHAKLLRVDARKAEKYPGVVAVVTRDDLTGLNPYLGPVVGGQPVVATDRVRPGGEVIALVGE